ncbi:MAG: hypothetical protein NTZ09_17880 [Candidatus Hydrogenedentes bacterium]|nr:hypothetical protein [Candidatus Hydrogenedentota bacterium]
MKSGTLCFAIALCLACLTAAGAADPAPQTVQLAEALVFSPQDGENIAALVFTEELEKRTGVKLPVTREWPRQGTVFIAALSQIPGMPPESYRLEASVRDGCMAVQVTGADERGILFGVGRLLRIMDWQNGSATVPLGLDITSAPAYPIRGHQLGYRHTANSYDAWNPRQYDQYIRELAIFGCNSIENIPFQDDASPVMPIPREQMNIAISQICERYNLDYWLWTPATFNLEDNDLRAKELDKHDALYKSLPRLDAIFFPGGDPGDNPPSLVMPFLKDLQLRLVKYHPKAGMWLSLQGFEPKQVDEFFQYLDQNKPQWLAGVVAGPQSPPIHELRRRLPRQYRLRDYPDITHNVLCQYPVSWWDLPYALTLGREPVNPRPRDYALIHNWSAPSTDGFISYSDGIHDDVNKTVWSVLGWEPATPVRDILVDYAAFFFGPSIASETADALAALETNWVGPLELNGSVDATYFNWQRLTALAPELASNWRWRIHLFRAQYDYFTRHRLIYESSLERQANSTLANANQIGPDAAMDQALEILNRAQTQPWAPDIRASLESHADALFTLIGYQTSVPKYHARNFERGEGKSRLRMSSLSNMDWPKAIVYDGLDTGRGYVLRLTGRGDALPRADGQLLQPLKYSKEIGQFKEFPIPKELVADGALRITFDPPKEPGINWPYSSMLTEAWLIPQ